MLLTRGRVAPLVVAALVGASVLAVWIGPAVVHAVADPLTPRVTATPDLAKPLHTVAQTAAPGVSGAGAFAHRDRRVLAVVWVLLAAEAGLLATLLWRRRHQRIPVADLGPMPARVIERDD